MRGLNLFRIARSRKDNRKVVHLLDSLARSHRLVTRSSYGAELMATSHGIDDAHPSLMAIIELTRCKPFSVEEMKDYREKGNLPLKLLLTVDAEGAYKSLTSRDLKVHTEKTFWDM